MNVLRIFNALYVIIGVGFIVNPPPECFWFFLIIYLINFVCWMKSMEGNMTPGGMN